MTSEQHDLIRRARLWCQAHARQSYGDRGLRLLMEDADRIIGELIGELVGCASVVNERSESSATLPSASAQEKSPDPFSHVGSGEREIQPTGLITLLEAAHAELCEAVKRQMDGRHALKLTIPADRKRDTDLIIGDALTTAILYLKGDDSARKFPTFPAPPEAP